MAMEYIGTPMEEYIMDNGKRISVMVMDIIGTLMENHILERTRIISDGVREF